MLYDWRMSSDALFPLQVVPLYTFPMSVSIFLFHEAVFILSKF
jgi:hypothetical protein